MTSFPAPSHLGSQSRTYASPPTIGSPILRVVKCDNPHRCERNVLVASFTLFILVALSLSDGLSVCLSLIHTRAATSPAGADNEITPKQLDGTAFGLI